MGEKPGEGDDPGAEARGPLIVILSEPEDDGESPLTVVLYDPDD